MFVCLYSGDEHILVVDIFQLPELAGANPIRSSPPTNCNFMVTTEVYHKCILFTTRELLSTSHRIKDKRQVHLMYVCVAIVLWWCCIKFHFHPFQPDEELWCPSELLL